MKPAKLAAKRARKAQKRKGKTYQGDKRIEQALRRMQTELALREQSGTSDTVFV